MTKDREELIDAYLAHVFETKSQGDTDRYFWAWEAVQTMVANQPEEAWSLIVALIERAPDERTLASIAAAPLEDLIASHGPHFIDRIEARATADAKLRRALRGVWHTERMSDDVFSRVLFLVKDEPPL